MNDFPLDLQDLILENERLRNTIKSLEHRNSCLSKAKCMHLFLDNLKSKELPCFTIKKDYDLLLKQYNEIKSDNERLLKQLHQIFEKKEKTNRQIKIVFIVFLILSALSVFCYLLTTEILPFWTFHFIELSFFTFWLIVYIQDRRHRQTFENLFYIISSSVCIVLTVFVMFMEAIS